MKNIIFEANRILEWKINFSNIVGPKASPASLGFPGKAAPGGPGLVPFMVGTSLWVLPKLMFFEYK